MGCTNETALNIDILYISKFAERTGFLNLFLVLWVELRALLYMLFKSLLSYVPRLEKKIFDVFITKLVAYVYRVIDYLLL